MCCTLFPVPFIFHCLIYYSITRSNKRNLVAVLDPSMVSSFLFGSMVKQNMTICFCFARLYRMNWWNLMIWLCVFYLVALLHEIGMNWYSLSIRLFYFYPVTLLYLVPKSICFSFSKFQQHLNVNLQVLNRWLHMLARWLPDVEDKKCEMIWSKYAGNGDVKEILLDHAGTCEMIWFDHFLSWIN